jgi:acyl-CoA thioesterase FadM
MSNLTGDIEEGPILASTSCEFKGAMTFPDTVTIGCATREGGVGEDSTTWSQSYACVSHKTGRVVATGEALMVNFNYQTGERMPMTQDMKRMLFGESN